MITRNKNHTVSLYTAYYIFLYLIYLVCFQFIQKNSMVMEWNLLSVLLPAIEIGLSSVICLLLWPLIKLKTGLFFKVILISIPFVLTVVYGGQLFSGLMSGAYLTEIAIENAAEIRYVRQPGFFVALSLFMFGWCVLAYRVLVSEVPGYNSKLLSLSVPCALGMCIVACGYTQQQTHKFSTVKDQLPPGVAFVKVVYERLSHLQENKELFRRFEQGEVDAVFPYRKDVAYPLQKFGLNSGPLPFPAVYTDKKPNIIVVFAEGFSARLMGTYQGIYPDLTPNLNRYSQKMLQVSNYYNHTAATYRGLKGQLTSTYTYFGGKMRGGWEDKERDNTANLVNLSYQSVANVLNSNGYDTVFFSPHMRHVSFGAFLKALDFQEVYDFETMATLTGEAVSPHSRVEEALRDKNIFGGLRTFLDQRFKSGDSKPFFVGTYNIGTHAFLDVTEGGLTYGDGNNRVLNRFHQFDYIMGEFLDYFFQSPFVDNTILIFTADHSTYPEPAYVRALKKDDITSYFVDEIPLLIHAPSLELPVKYDAHYRNSLDFAPTLMHLLGISNFTHSWLGQSIFDQSKTRKYSFAAVGHEFYKIDEAGVHLELDDSPFADTVRTIYVLEQKNRLYGENRGDVEGLSASLAL